MSHPSDRKYSKEHEWVLVEATSPPSASPTSRRTSSARSSTSTCPSAGDTLGAGDTFGEIESVKSVSELYAPVTGEIVEVNESLSDSPETVNPDPHGEGWMIKVTARRRGELDALMSAEEYDAFITEA